MIIKTKVIAVDFTDEDLAKLQKMVKFIEEYNHVNIRNECSATGGLGLLKQILGQHSSTKKEDYND